MGGTAVFYSNLPEKERDELLNAILQALLDKYEMLAVDEAGRFVLVTDKFATRIGRSPREILTMSVDDMVARKIYTKSASLVTLKTGAPKIVLTTSGQNSYTLGQSTPLLDENGKLKYVLSEGLSVERLLAMVDEVRQEELPSQQLMDLRKALLFSKTELIYRSGVMADIVRRAERVAQYDTNTLILGESGVGKDVMARHIHECSNRRGQQFVPVCIPMISPNLMESELFGYVGGSFTGASKEGKMGLFEMADGGTVFLDEVGDIPMDMQVKILRVLENREIFRVGSNKPISLNIRIIAATNKKLYQMVRDGTFREDLYYRLNVLSLEIPPLRERPEDIEPLARHFLMATNRRYGFRRTFSPGALRLLQEYSWPGNARALRNFVEKTAILTETDVIEEAYTRSALSDLLSSDNAGVAESQHSAPSDSRNIMAEFSAMKRETILNALMKCNGNKTKAAKMLNISRSHLYKLIRSYEQNQPDSGGKSI